MRRRIGSLLLSLLMVFCLGGCTDPGISLTGMGSATAEGAEILMDTVCSFSITASSEEKAREIYEKMVSVGNDLENNKLSRYVEGSELYNINGLAGEAKLIGVSEEMSGYLDSCLTLSTVSGGAFDITIGALCDLWGIEDAVKNGTEDFTPPGDEEIADILKLTGYDKMSKTGSKVSVPEGMVLDLGAVGKGIFLDEAGKQADGIEYGIIAAGGSIRTIGYKPGGDDWKVGIKDPAHPDKIIETLSLTGDHVISTSGSYERYVEKDGVRYHHIFDPRTGKPADSGLSSVTVVMDATYGNGLLSDALSTAILVLGKEKGTELARMYNASVILVTDEGEVIKCE